MKPTYRVLCAWLVLSVAGRLAVAQPGPDESPADKLPPHISRATWFGERADWSHDGKRVLFLSKTFGDALELTAPVFEPTAHYPHGGYTRALYLRTETFSFPGRSSWTAATGRSTRAVLAHVLDRSGTKPASRSVPSARKARQFPAGACISPGPDRGSIPRRDARRHFRVSGRQTSCTRTARPRWPSEARAGQPRAALHLHLETQTFVRRTSGS